MKTAFALSCLIIGISQPKLVASQSVAIETNMGYAITRLSTMKKIALSTGVNGRYEFASKKRMTIALCSGGSLLQYSTHAGIDNPIFHKRYFLNFTSYLRHYYPLTEKWATYFEIGPMVNYEALYKAETTCNGILTKEWKSIGNFNIAIAGGIGVKFTQNNRLIIDIGFSSQDDFAAKNKEAIEGARTQRRYFRLSICKKLEKDNLYKKRKKEFYGK